MKLALRVTLLACVLLAVWFIKWRTSNSSEVDAVAPTAKAPAKELAVEPNDPPASVEPPRVEVSPATDSREGAPTPEPDGVALSAKTSAATTLLRVHVVAKETRRPLAAERVMAIPMGIDRWSVKHIEGSHAATDESPITDANGSAELEVEPGHELSVQIGGHGREPIKVTALTAGEQRDVEIDVPTEPDRVLFGRLVDAETNNVIANGAVWCEGDSSRVVSSRRGSDSTPSTPESIPEDAVRSRTDGAFDLHVRSWIQRFANAKADGYSRVVFAIDANHATRDSALEVRLSRAATLEVVVLDGGRPAGNATIDLTTDSYQLQQGERMLSFYSGSDPHWSGRTDANGRVVIGDLPPRIPLTLSVRAGAAKRTEGEPLTFEAGERRRIEIALGSGASIVGRIEDSSGKPLASCDIWRVAAAAPVAKLLESYEDPVATTRSDEQGNFRFDDVALGTWLVGPKPESRHNRGEKTANALAALAEPVVIDANSHQVNVVLRIDIGLYLRGTVVDPDGVAVGNTHVSARRNGAMIYINDNVDETGHFTLGPVPAGSYTLEAGNYRGAYAKSESVTAQAGDSDIVLRLRLGGGIHGRVVDATHQPRECELTLSREGEEYGWMMTATKDGSLKFDGLLPGTYTVSAKTSDGLCGRRSGLVVRAGETMDDVEVELAPGARLKLRYDGEERYGNYQIFIGGIASAGDSIERGNQSVVVVPAGEVEVRWNAFLPEKSHSQRVTLGVGEEREIVWDGKP